MHMPIIKVDGTSLGYYLIAFCKTGKVRNESEAEIQEILRVLSSESITDVFIFSHGWLGDVPAAKQQYAKWIKKMAAQEADIQLMQQKPRGFRPLLIGLHWPSLPWGDEKLESEMADTQQGKEVLRAIDQELEKEYPSYSKLSPNVNDTYVQLDKETALGNKGVGAKPGSDRESFNPQRIFKEFIEKALEEGEELNKKLIKEALKAPLRTLSFWRMKALACQIGESGGSQFLKKLQEKAPTARFHLMGHSFGCIVVSAMLASPESRGTLIRPVNSLALAQGALSLWSYCAKIPALPSRPGYFHRLIADGRVAGPIITTHSEHDTAVGIWYPLAAGVARQIDYAPGELPKYGGIGYWGIKGDDLNVVEMDMLPFEDTYEFEPSKIYNLNSKKFIVDGHRDAHNKITEPEVTHAVWSAAFSS